MTSRKYAGRSMMSGVCAGSGFPLQLLGADLGALVLGAPPLDETRIDVDDPILQHVLSPAIWQS